MKRSPSRPDGKAWQRRLDVLRALPSDPDAARRIARAARREAGAAARRARARFARPTVALPRFEIPDGPIVRPHITAAVILDPFSELAFGYEWRQIPLTPEGWAVELQTTTPDLLFVESAWQGSRGAWKHAMTGAGAPAPELRALLAWCREHGVPTVFWNKEDPPNYDRFRATAALFDHVFTVDADRIPDYVRDLGHERVGLLPFGAQPRIHNPVRHDDHGATRPYDVAFAGTYFAEKHPQRRAQMEYVLGPARTMGLDIYSRMQTEDRRYRFPAAFRANIVGSLAYEKMLAAYTAYKVFLNVNSVTESPTMCARRLFELSAAQTAVVSSPAASIPTFFGDDITVVHDAAETALRLGNLLRQKELRDRVALRAHRRVYAEHLYAHRVDTILAAAGVDDERGTRGVSIIVPTMRPEQLEHILEFVARQSYADCELVLIPHGFAPDPTRLAQLRERHRIEHFTLLPGDPAVTLGALMRRGVAAASGHYVAKMDDDNYYGEHFLADLIHAFAYTSAEVVGKWAHFAHVGDQSGPTLLRFPAAEHRFVRLVQGGTIVTPRAVASEIGFEELPRRVDTTFLDKVRQSGGHVYSADRFNFVSHRAADTSGHTWSISAEELMSRSSELLFFGDATAHATV